MVPDQNTISVIEELNLPIRNIFMIDNTAFEEIDFESLMKNVPNYNLAVKRAIFDQRRSYAYNKENIKQLINGCQQFESFDTFSIKPIYTANARLLSAIETFVEMKLKVASDKHQYNINEAGLQLRLLNKDSENNKNGINGIGSTESKNDLNINEYGTRCTECDSESGNKSSSSRRKKRGCHEPCHCVPFGKRVDKCKIFYNGNIKRSRCKECGHSVSSHLHMRLKSNKAKTNSTKRNGKNKNKNKNKGKNKSNKDKDQQEQTKQKSSKAKQLMISIDSPGNRLLKTMKDIIVLTQELIDKSSMLVYNDYINQFIQESTAEISDATSKNNANHNNKGLQILLIKNDFCKFFQIDSVSLQREILVKISNDNDNSDDNSVESVIMSLLKSFSNEHFGKGNKESKNKKNKKNKKNNTKSADRNKQLKEMDNWNKFWDRNSVTYFQFDTVYNLVNHLSIKNASLDNNKENNHEKDSLIYLKLFDSGIVERNITDCMGLFRDQIDEDCNYQVISNTCKIIIRSIQVRFILYTLLI